MLKPAAAAGSLANVGSQEGYLAQQQGVFTSPTGTHKIPVIVCAQGTPLWQVPATRCDVLVGFWQDGVLVQETKTFGRRGG